MFRNRGTGCHVVAAFVMLQTTTIYPRRRASSSNVYATTKMVGFTNLYGVYFAAMAYLLRFCSGLRATMRMEREGKRGRRGGVFFKQ
ncbi:hypothetical protein SASPL_111371 [Salvia splendens]|uniref:Uncharacterized protein n=1 Tax=Salvia splendens TaxID=180675 RepID=A0A8X8Y6P3_SALSN|nr:hypothetical protein SASPL_111371 [Salvia splendens]